MNEQAENRPGSGEEATSGKGFFILNLLQVERMVQQGAGAEEVMAYLVLVRGTSVAVAGYFSTAAGVEHAFITAPMGWA